MVADARFQRLLGESILRARPELGLLTPDRLEAEGGEDQRAAPEDLAFIQFSSGTTVEPKPVALTHRNVLSNVEAFDSVIEAAGGWSRGVSWLPLYHDMGLIGGLLASIYRTGSGRNAWPVLLPR